MFKFNFNQADVQDSSNTNEQVTGHADKCQEHSLKEISNVLHESTEVLTLDPFGIKYVKSSDAINRMEEKPTFLQANSDLVKNVYEGGMKIWECSLDLVQYLSKCSQMIEGKRVLEIGCGAALPGLFCILSKARHVVLQDYNAQVIDFITVPNCILNNGASHAIQLYSGDWSDFLEKLKLSNVKFDLILTSETIYEESNYPKLLAMFDQLLSDNGCILLAAKAHYFGVGGGILNFQCALEKEQKWKCVSVYENCDTVKREILEIKRK